MNEIPLVSIITPSYNQGTFIGETIESVLKQDYPHIEYIIMDGGSQDETLDVIRRYEHNPRLRWISEADRGMTHALNKGFHLAKGMVMGWLNSDDVFIGESVISELVTYLQEHPEQDLVYGDIAYIDENSQSLQRGLKGKEFDFLDTLSYATSVPQPGTLWRKALWEKAGDLREDLRYIMDTEYWLRLSRYGKFAYFSGERVNFRIHANSITQSNELGVWQERRKVMEELFLQGDVFPELIGQRNRLEASLAFKEAQYYLRVNNYKKVKEKAQEAFWKAPLGKRKLAFLALYLDSIWGTNWALWIQTIWSKIK